MKKWIVIATLIASGFSTADAASKPSKFVNGTVQVNRTWMVKKADGTFDVKSDFVCDVKVRIPYLVDAEGGEISPDTMKVSECVTETRNKKPVKLAIFGLVLVGDNKRADGSVERMLAFSGSYAFTQAPSKNSAGSFATFSTKEYGLKSGTLLLPSPSKTYEKPEDVYEDTFFSANLSYEQ